MIIKLEVSEPWDFTGPDGSNVILAQSSINGTGRFGSWLICQCKPFIIKGASVSSLLLSQRYRSNDSLISQLYQNKKILVNAYWRHSGKGWDMQAIIKAETDSSIIGGWLIASVQQI